MKELDKEYEASLKSIETENKIDRIFYRPIGFKIAQSLRNTGITPNQITIISIFVGAGAGFLFYHEGLGFAIAGIVVLVVANILDCVDGQLARLTGIKSQIGRILDGMAGDIWFTSIYIGLALRLTHLYGTPSFFVLAVLSGLSHLVQANITDYYKTLHLYFINREKGKEFQTLEQIKAQHKAMKPGINKFFYFLYVYYSTLQVKVTPKLQQMLKSFRHKYGENIPEEIRVSFRKQSCKIMKSYLDFLTFNGRTIVLFILVLIDEVWLYFIYETVVLNFILFLSVKKHERTCASFI